MKCKNCKYWKRTSKKYGKCFILGSESNLRVSDDKSIFPLTPFYAICKNFKKNEKTRYSNTIS